MADDPRQMTQAAPNPPTPPRPLSVRWLRKHRMTREDIIDWNDQSSAEAEQRICHICQMISDMLHRIGIGKKRR
jgi:hypothetical protein